MILQRSFHTLNSLKEGELRQSSHYVPILQMSKQRLRKTDKHRLPAYRTGSGSDPVARGSSHPGARGRGWGPHLDSWAAWAGGIELSESTVHRIKGHPPVSPGHRSPPRPQNKGRLQGQGVVCLKSVDVPSLLMIVGGCDDMNPSAEECRPWAPSRRGLSSSSCRLTPTLLLWRGGAIWSPWTFL